MGRIDQRRDPARLSVIAQHHGPQIEAHLVRRRQGRPQLAVNLDLFLDEFEVLRVELGPLLEQRCRHRHRPECRDAQERWISGLGHAFGLPLLACGSRGRGLGVQQCPCMQGDHQVFIRRNHPGRGAAARARDHCPAGCIGALIQIDAEPCGVLAHPAPDFRRVLADSGGEDQSVDPAEGGGHRAQFAPDTIDEQRDRLLAPTDRRWPAGSACRR